MHNANKTIEKNKQNQASALSVGVSHLHRFK